MVRKGDTFEDLKKYILFRERHLYLEQQRIPFTVDTNKIDQAIKKIKGRRLELIHLKKVVSECIKEASKYEWRRVEYLKKKKIKHQKCISTKRVHNKEPVSEEDIANAINLVLGD